MEEGVRGGGSCQGAGLSSRDARGCYSGRLWDGGDATVGWATTVAAVCIKTTRMCGRRHGQGMRNAAGTNPAPHPPRPRASESGPSRWLVAYSYPLIPTASGVDSRCKRVATQPHRGGRERRVKRGDAYAPSTGRGRLVDLRAELLHPHKRRRATRPRRLTNHVFWVTAAERAGACGSAGGSRAAAH